MIEKIKYSLLSTFELIEKIAAQSDLHSLNCFLSERKLLQLNRKRYLLPEYLQLLRNRKYYPFITIPPNEKKLEEKIDLVYERTLFKFSILSTHAGEISGPFCDNQYRSLHKQVTMFIEANPNTAQIDLELEIESLIKKMVIRHLKYSWLEACRNINLLYQRYRWQLSSGTIELMKPISIKGRKFTKWLEEHIENPNPNDVREKQRIQKEINNWFGHSAEMSLDEENGLRNTLHSNYDPMKLIEEEYLGDKFFEKIAKEKSTNCHLLRSTIRNLGEVKIYQLVHKILSSFEYDEFNDTEIANEFGLSKATYSRFAGRDWKKGGIYEVPDLWRNIAHVVTHDPIFLEVAIDLGVRDVIYNVLDATKEK